MCFTLNKYIAFRDRSPVTWQQLGRFGLVAVATALLMALAMQLVAVKLGVPYLRREADLLGARVRRVDLSRAAPARVRRRIAVAKEPVMTTLVPFVDLSIVVPAYNEEHRLPPTLERLHAFLVDAAAALRDRRRRRRLEGRHVRRRRVAMATIPDLRLVRQTPNRGKGAAVRRGMLEARGQIRVMCDADGSMPPEQLPKLLAPIIALQGRDRDRLALRRGREDRRQAAVLSRAVEPARNRVIQRSLVPGVRDTQCGFKAFTAEAARDLFALRRAIDGWAFDLEILALARRRGFAIAEVGVEWKDDRRSRVNPLKDMWKVIREAMTIRRNLKRGVYNRPLPV